MTKVWLYGLDDKKVIKTGWMWNSASDGQLEFVAKMWKSTYGCTRIFAMMDSKSLRDAWFDYLRSCGKKDGSLEFAQIEFTDYLESGDWELAKCS